MEQLALQANVFNHFALIVMVISIPLGLFCTFLGLAYSRAATLLLLALTIAVIAFGYNRAEAHALAAITTDWEQAVDLKSTYFEKLHGVWVRYDEVVHTCRYRDNDSNFNDTGCTYVTVNSYCDSRDEDGNCDDWDYEFKPWFTHEISQTAELNIFKNGHVVFATHWAPEDWQSAKTWDFPFYAQPGQDFSYGYHPEWLRVKVALDNNQIMAGTVWNTYRHWIYPDDLTLLTTFSSHIDSYNDRGLLPVINMVQDSNDNNTSIDIYGNVSGVGYDYEIVQFMNLDVSAEDYATWQDTAHLWAAMAGPEIQSSLIVFFAPSDQIDNSNQWMTTSKAWLMSKGESDLPNELGFGRYILPKNVVLIGCGVSSDMTMVEWCRAETGMPGGNQPFIVNVNNRLEPFAFDPQTAFGTMSGGFATDENGNFILENPDWDDRNTEMRIAQIDFSGGVLDEFIRAPEDPTRAFERVEMESFLDKRISIDPDPEQITAIFYNRSREAFKLMLLIWGTIYAFGFGAIYYGNQS